MIGVPIDTGVIAVIISALGVGLGLLINHLLNKHDAETIKTKSGNYKVK